MKNQARLRTGLKVACAAMLAVTVGGQAQAAGEDRAIDQISRYCTTSWRNAQIPMEQWQDCTQQAFTELLTRVPRSELTVAIEDRFSSARRELNRSIWCVAQRSRRAQRHYSMFADEILEPQAAASSDQSDDLSELGELISASENGLSERQRSILDLCRLGYSVAEIASELEVSPARVSDDKYKAIKKLQNYVDSSGLLT